jgi:hypothetical protein
MLIGFGKSKIFLIFAIGNQSICDRKRKGLHISQMIGCYIPYIENC